MPNDINLEDFVLGRLGSSIRFAFPSSLRNDMMCRNLLILFNSITHIISFTEYAIVPEEEPGLPSMEIERGEEKPGPTRGSVCFGRNRLLTFKFLHLINYLEIS